MALQSLLMKTVILFYNSVREFLLMNVDSLLIDILAIVVRAAEGDLFVFLIHVFMHTVFMEYKVTD